MLPERCRSCAVSTNPTRTACQLCADTGFDQTILCEMNQAAQQDADGFECGAFRPILTVAGASKPETPPPDSVHRENPLEERLSVAKLMNSDLVKYRRSLALQMLGADPDAVIVGLEYHFAWNVRARRSVFVDAKKYAPLVNELLHGVRVPSVLHAGLLWLAPDHIHVYCSADGARPVDALARGLRAALEQGLTDFEEGLWADHYFVSSIG